MKKYSVNKAKGKEGISFVSYIISHHKSIIRELPEETDIGLDATIELIQNEIALGIWIGLQIKSGYSYVKDINKKSFSVRLNKDDLEYLDIQPFPVALIAVEPTEQLGAWIDIRKYIQQYPKCLVKNNSTIVLDGEKNPFNIHSFNSFKNYFIEQSQSFSINRYLDLIISNDKNLKFSGILGLLSDSGLKFSKITCYFLLVNLFTPSKELRAMITDALSRFLPHPEASFSFNEDLRNYVRKYLMEFGTNEIVQLLETSLLDEENLFKRGSLGQCAATILFEIPNYASHLINILKNIDTPFSIKKACIHFAWENSIFELIEFISFNTQTIDWDGLEEEVSTCSETFADFEEKKYDLNKIIAEKGFDEVEIAEILQKVSIKFLIQNIETVKEVYIYSANYSNREEASNAMNKVDLYFRVNNDRQTKLPL